MNKNVSQDLESVLNSGYISQGPKVEEFENLLREYLNCQYLLAVNSCTSALTLALRLLNLEPDDEVLTCPLTCTATNWPILANNLKIKWVDADPKTCNISLSDLESKITKDTKAILVIHWGGSPVDLAKLKEIQDRKEKELGFKITIIEDCAHAFGAELNGRKIGNSENICCFSFQAIKLLTTGDGGLITFPNQELYRRAKLLRWFGIDREKRSGGGDFRLEADIPEWGYKFHMNDINASIGISNFSTIESNLQKNRSNVQFLKDNLRDLPSVKLLDEVPNSKSSYWIFTILIERKAEFIDFMKNKGITVSQVHKRNDVHSCVSKFKTELPGIDELEKKMICIPSGWWLSNDDLNYIVKCIKEFF